MLNRKPGMMQRPSPPQMAVTGVRPVGIAPTFVAGLCALSIAVPAMAAEDPPIGSRLGKRLEREKNSRYDDQDSRRTAREIARCFYTRKKSSVETFLSTTDPQVSERAYRNLWDNARCSTITVMGGGAQGLTLSAPIDIMRGNFAEAALASRPEVASLSALPALPPEKADYRRDWFALSGRDPTVNEMAVCVAEQNPAGIRALIATKAEAPEEKAAVQAIAPTLGPCLPQGATLKANRQGLRAALAEALYQRVVAPARLAVQ